MTSSPPSSRPRATSRARSARAGRSSSRACSRTTSPTPVASSRRRGGGRLHGATWAAPEGPRSDVDDRGDHPVVHVSRVDAEEYAAWRGARLPIEHEWEYAARGGLVGAVFPWGDELEPGGEHRMNVWQGTFPSH